LHFDLLGFERFGREESDLLDDIDYYNQKTLDLFINRKHAHFLFSPPHL